LLIILVRLEKEFAFFLVILIWSLLCMCAG
jgi:hypothetical protein